MEENNLIKYESGQLQKVGNAIAVTDKLLSLYEPQLIPYRKKDKWGYCTPDKKIVIDCIYEDAQPFGNGLGAVSMNKKWGFIDTRNTLRIPAIYNKVNVFSNSLAGVRNSPKGKWGFLNTSGKLELDFHYYNASKFKKGVSEVTIVDENMGIKYLKINSKGEYINQNEDIDSISNNGLVATYDKDGKWGFCNENNVEVIPFIFDDVREFYENFAAVSINDQWGYVDINGVIRIAFKYKYALEFDEGLAEVLNNYLNKGYINKDGIEFWEE